MGIHLINDVFTNVTLTQTFTIKYLFTQFWCDVGDPRVSQYFLIRSGPLFTLSIVAFYLYFSISLGPKIMANRRPFKLRPLILCYNIMMVLLNLKYLIFMIGFLDYGIDLVVFDRISLRDDWSTRALQDLDQIHSVFISKFIDLLDTVFFVLRKKDRHISVLHLYHHSAVPILFWVGYRLMPLFSPLGIFVLLNCTIHVLMYAYYALSSFGPKIQPYLWWKKYITQIQMIQFVVYGFYAIYCSLVIDGFPFYLQVIVHIQSPIFLALFGHFYIKAYIKNKNKLSERTLSLVNRNGNGVQKSIKCNDNNNNNENDLDNKLRPDKID